MKRFLKSDNLTYYSLFIVSTYMSILMFIHIGDSFVTRISLGLLALIFEMTKLTDLKKYVQKVKFSSIYGISYLCKAMLSIVASVGLVLTLLSAQDAQTQVQNNFDSQYASTVNNEIEYWEEEIGKLNETVTLLNENIDRLPKGYGKAGTSFVNQIKALQLLKDEYRENYTNAMDKIVEHLYEESQEEISSSPSDMFNEVGKTFNISSDKLKIVIFISIMVLIEVSLALSVFTLSDTVTEQIKPEHVPKEYSIPKKAFKVCMSISEHQREKEQGNEKLLTHKELSKILKTTPAIVSNMYRRYLNGILKELKGDDPYSQVCELIKTS